MLQISVQSDSLEGAQQKLVRALSRTAKALARITAEETSEQMQGWFDIRDAYVTKGMRYKLESSNGNLAQAVAYHRDRYLRKQEGATMSGLLAVPTQWARKKHPKYYTRRPKHLLQRLNFYKDDQGIWERKEGVRPRLWYNWTSSAKFEKRMQLEKVAQAVANDNAEELFRLFTSS